MVLQTPPTPGTPELSTTALYCYGVVSADAAASQAGTGLGGASVEPVPFRELAALTSPVPPRQVRAKRADLLRHFDVLGTAFEHATAAPPAGGCIRSLSGTSWPPNRADTRFCVLRSSSTASASRPSTRRWRSSPPSRRRGSTSRS